MDESDVIGNQVPFYVDMSLKDIYMTIASGAEVVVIPQTYFMSPKKLLTYLDENHVTMLMWVPTAYSIISRFDGLSRVKPSALKKLVFSGEVMPSSVYRYWAKEYPDALWIQLYGPTEITGACTYFILDREYEEDEMIPIGKAFDNTGILLLDENDAEIKEADVPGEICIYGSCLAAGYYNDPEKTQQSFVQNPLVKAYPSRMYRTGDLAKWNENGDLVFVSRMDYQIKHGGRRIELGEIEAAADLVENIGNVCVVHDSGTDTIVMVYTGELTDKEIRSQLKDRLPQYMIPGKYIRTESLPQLPNGKLNRKAVLQMVQEAE
jgi:non-ribosomal peptide synthetase component F